MTCNLEWLVQEEVDDFIANQGGFDPYRDLATEEVRTLAAEEGPGIAEAIRENELSVTVLS
jgi:hypothetical protein